MDRLGLMYDRPPLVCETDPTRLITLMLDSVNSPVIEVPGAEITDGYHSLSHHGKSTTKLGQLESIDREHMRLLAALFATLKGCAEGGESLFERSMILYGSNLGNANTHVTTNLPVLLAGGGVKHARHLGFGRGR